MEVATGRTVLLRGKTYNDYSGLNWYDTLSSRRYLYASPRFSSLREQLFGLNKPLAGAENGGRKPCGCICWRTAYHPVRPRGHPVFTDGKPTDGAVL